MQNFIYDIPTKIYFGRGQIEEISRIAQIGSRALITYGGGSVKRTGLLDRAKEILDRAGVQYMELPGIEPNPRIDTVRKGIALCRAHKLDVVLALGGGSTIDCSKLISAGALYEGEPWDLVLDPNKIHGAIPLVAVLTLAATGSEMNWGCVISNPATNEKLPVKSPYLFPRFSILDPELTFTVPKTQTAAGVADIISHILECYFTPVGGGEVQAQFAEGLLRVCLKYGPIAYDQPDHYEARANLMWASTHAINGLCSLGVPTGWSVHPLEHEVSAYYDVTHGVGLAILTPHWMRYVMNDQTIARFERLGENVFGLPHSIDPYETAGKMIEKLIAFFEGLRIPMKLSALGVDETNFEAMARHCQENTLEGFVPLDWEDNMRIYRAAL